MTTKTDDIKLLPCPFCGGEAEMDTRQGYLALGTGRLGNRIAVYCRRCDADMGVCIEDVPDITPEQVAEMWNRRAAVEADRQQTAAQLLDPVFVHGNMCRGIIAPITFDMLAHVLGEEATKAWLAGHATDRQDHIADVRKMVPSDEELDDLSDEFHGYSGNHTRDGYLIPKFDYLGFARTLMSRYGSSQPATPPATISRDLLGRIVDEAFDGACEDTSPIEDIYRVIVREYGQPAASAAPLVPDCVWESLQRLIENGAALGAASRDDALVVARYRDRQKFMRVAPVAQEPHPDYSEMSRETLERHAASMAQLLSDDKPRAFWERYAIGPKSAPSCICCGHVPDEVAIQHAEIPSIVVCRRCHDAATAPVAQEPVAWIRTTDITEFTDTEPETDGWTALYAAPVAAQAHPSTGVQK